jgi:outer membrane protein OmpA-like peptidoglycan-associated protein
MRYLLASHSLEKQKEKHWSIQDIFKTMLRSCLFISLFIFSILASAQDRKPVLAEADDYFAHEGYAKAAILYETLLKKNNDITLLRKLGYCYRSINAYAPAAAAYKRLTETGKANTGDWIDYGDVQKSLGLYEEAKQSYSKVPADSMTRVAQKIAGCDSAMRWMKEPSPLYSLQNMEMINTGLSDWGANYYPGKESNVFFVSAYERREVMDPKAKLASYPDKRTNEPFYNIYVLDSSMHDFIHGLPPAFNQFRFHTGPLVFSKDLRTAYLTVTNIDKISYEKTGKQVNGKRRLSLQVLRHQNGQWTPAQAFTFNNTAAYSIGHAAISNDGKTLYFTSDMPGGYGKTDIWYCERINDSTWDAPRNCGPVINTAEEDDFPVINDGEAIYFSSKGHVGMGGLDIFYAKGEKNNWQPPQNMRWPINSEGDDFYFVQKNAQEGLLSSNRGGGKGGDDIYSYRAVPPAVTIPPINKTNRLLIVAISVVNAEDGKPVGNANVWLNNSWLQQTPANGKVYQSINDNQAYQVTANKQGYIGAEQNFHSEGQKDTIHVLLALQRITTTTPEKPKSGLPVGQEIELENIYYDFDKWNIRSDARPALDKLVALLRSYPEMKVELGSHTDCRGTDAYNQLLSEKRAASAVAYIVQQGIDASRIRSKGYGESRLVNDCDCGKGTTCSEALHQQNRRTVFTILKE